MKGFRMVGALAFVVIALSTGCQSDEELQEWVLAWQDEFDGPAGQVPDTTRWRFDIGTGWGNNQLEYDTDRPENVSTEGSGFLAVTAINESYLNSQFTSGRINTSGFFTQKQGRFEARIKLPVGQGIWPAFWLLGSNFQDVGWPDCGEIDIMEYRGQQPNIVHGTIHGPGYSGGNAITGTYVLPGGIGFDGDFHVFAIEWNDERIMWLIDKQPYQSFRRSDLPAGAPWVFDHPFFIILNVAVGGNFVGPPNAQTSFPQTMYVDWVRVYKLQ